MLIAIGRNSGDLAIPFGDAIDVLLCIDTQCWGLPVKHLVKTASNYSDAWHHEFGMRTSTDLIEKRHPSVVLASVQ